MKCIEALVMRVKPDKVEDFVHINAARRERMLQKEPACSDVSLIRVPFLEYVYVRIAVWDSKKTAMQYCTERWARPQWHEFADDYLREFGVVFVEDSDISDAESVPEALLKKHFLKS